MFIAKEIIMITVGSGGCGVVLTFRSPERTMSNTYARNHGIARVVPANIKAPIGERIDQIITAPETAKPPKLH
jgi:hypothetical protein